MAGTFPELEAYRTIERQYFRSLANLEKLYGSDTYPCRNLIFPLNILKSFQFASAQLAAIDPKLEMMILQDASHQAVVTVVKRFYTNHTLYYIPVEPLYDLLQDASKIEDAQLLLSVCAYLYQIVGVVHYRDYSSYLFYMYDWIESCRLDDEEADPEELNYISNHLEKIYGAGDWVLQQLKSPVHLEQFIDRLSAFDPSSPAEEMLQRVARDAFSLRADYPDRSFNQGIEPDLYEDDDQGIVRTENYLSFFWNFDDCIYDELMEYINSDLNEHAVTEEPLTLQYFRSPQQQESHDHDFNIRLFQIVNALIDCMMTLENEHSNHKLQRT